MKNPRNNEMLMMKRTMILLLALCLVCGAAFAENQEEREFLWVQDGMLQPVLICTDLRDENYSNENSGILRFCVWVETDYDTDLDGSLDTVLDDSTYDMVISNESLELVLPVGEGDPNWLWNLGE